MQISKIGQYEDHEVYKLTDRRMKVVNDCIENHKGHTSCGRNDLDLYQSISSSLTLMLELSLTTFHSQQLQTVASSVRNSRKRKVADTYNECQSIIQYEKKSEVRIKDEAKEDPAQICKVCKKQSQSLLNHLARPNSRCQPNY